MRHPMVGGKGTHRTSRVIRHLRMSRALGIRYSRGMLLPSSRTRGPERRKGTWWDVKNNCIAIEGQDFAQDTQEGGADQFMFIPDSDDEGGHNGPYLNGDDDEIVPETEPHDIIVVNKGRGRLGAMLHDWRQIILEEEQQCSRLIATKEQKELATCSKEKDHKASAKEDKEEKDHKASAKEDKEEKDHKASAEEGKEEKDHKASAMEDTEHEELCQRASFSDLETDDEASWVEDGVDLRGHSQVDEDSWVQNDEESHGYSHVESDDFKDKVFCFLWIVQIKWKASIMFHPVVGGGANGSIIHYSRNDRKIKTGDLLLMDVGCEYHGYLSDLTRTWPPCGRFSPAQDSCTLTVSSSVEGTEDDVRSGA